MLFFLLFTTNECNYLLTPEESEDKQNIPTVVEYKGSVL